jgi:hypothetical protein
MSGNMLLDSNIIVSLSKGELDHDTFFDEDKTYDVSVVSYMETLGFAFETSREQEFVQHLLSLFRFSILTRPLLIKSSKSVKRRKSNFQTRLLQRQHWENRVLWLRETLMISKTSIRYYASSILFHQNDPTPATWNAGLT